MYALSWCKTVFYALSDYKMLIFSFKNMSSSIYTRYTFEIMSLETESLQTVASWTMREGLVLMQEDIWRFRQFSNKTFDILTLPVIPVCNLFRFLFNMYCCAVNFLRSHVLRDSLPSQSFYPAILFVIIGLLQVNGS